MTRAQRLFRRMRSTLRAKTARRCQYPPCRQEFFSASYNRKYCCEQHRRNMMMWRWRRRAGRPKPEGYEQMRDEKTGRILGRGPNR
jgi:hypothetical protein